MNFRYKLMQFMSGRYGTDKLTYILLAVAMVIAFLNIFIRSFVLQMVVYAILAYATFRTFSRNISARRRENDFVINKLNFIKHKRELYNRRKNDKLHVYKKCPACKAILRLPHRIGKHTTVCPRCGKEFKVKVRK